MHITSSRNVNRYNNYYHYCRSAERRIAVIFKYSFLFFRSLAHHIVLYSYAHYILCGVRVHHRFRLLLIKTRTFENAFLPTYILFFKYFHSRSPPPPSPSHHFRSLNFRFCPNRFHITRCTSWVPAKRNTWTTSVSTVCSRERCVQVFRRTHFRDLTRRVFFCNKLLYANGASSVLNSRAPKRFVLAAKVTPGRIYIRTATTTAARYKIFGRM